MGETCSAKQTHYSVILMFILQCATTCETSLQACNNKTRCHLSTGQCGLTSFSVFPETLNFNPRFRHSQMCIVASGISFVCMKSRYSCFPNSLSGLNNLNFSAAFLHRATVQWRCSPSPMAAQSTIRRWRTKPLLFLRDVLC